MVNFQKYFYEFFFGNFFFRIKILYNFDMKDFFIEYVLDEKYL